MNEICAPGSLKMPSGDRDGMAAAMYSIMQSSHDEVWARGRMAREHARQHEWDSMAASQLAFREAVAAAHLGKGQWTGHGA
jgi:hypothetical protein